MDIKRYDNNLDGPTALRNAGLMVQDHPDVAIDWNTVVGVGAAVGAQFTRNNVKCLAVNQQIPGCAWFNLSNKQFGARRGGDDPPRREETRVERQEHDRRDGRCVRRTASR